MRPILHGDVVAAARLLMGIAPRDRPGVIVALLTRADAADRYRKRTGRVHPFWGNGSLLAAASVRGLRPEPFLDDPDYCQCFVEVFEALVRWRAERCALSGRRRRRWGLSDQAPGA